MDIATFLEANASILIAAFIAAFLIDFLANLISFGNRWVSALVTSLLLVAALVFVLVMNRDDIAVQPLAMAGGVMFVVALLGNYFSFSNRFLNALVTAVLFLIPFSIGLFLLLGLTGHGSLNL